MSRANDSEPSVEARLKVLEQFILALTHECRAPLSVIRNATYMLRRMSASTPDIAECASLIDQEVQDLNHMLGRLVEIVRPSQLVLADTPLRELIDRAVQRVDQEGRAKWRLVVEFEPAFIQCDVERLQYVMEQIFQNAMYATRGIGTVDVRAIRDENAVTIDISDNGTGVMPELQSRIFEPFVTTKKTGMGLGLTYCTQILKGHGGSLQLVNSTDAGACFRLTLPRVVAVA